MGKHVWGPAGAGPSRMDVRGNHSVSSDSRAPGCVVSERRPLVETVISAAAICVALVAAPVSAQTDVETPGTTVTSSDATTVNTTQANMTAVILASCPSGTNEAEFQTRCNAVANAGGLGTNEPPSDALNAIQRVAPEQALEQGTQATRVSGGQVTEVAKSIAGRLTALRGGGPTTVQVNLNGLPVVDGTQSSPVTGGAAGDEGSGPLSRLGVFVNGTYNFGEVDSTRNQVGFDFDNYGVTAGVDYRITNNFIVGVAGNYFHTDSDFDGSRGDSESDTFGGSIYTTYYPTDRFYVDAVATYGSIDFDTTRKIQYVLPTDTVNAEAKGDPDGDQYYFGVGAGYDFPLQAVTITPYGRVNYLKVKIDSFRESGGDGWGMRFSSQNVKSFTTTAGAQASIAVSQSWGVVVPQLRLEWVHEFEDAGDDLDVTFLGDTTSGQSFTTVTESTERNYFNLGAEVAAQFARGMSAFVGYNALLAYDNISSNTFTLGTRIEF